MLSLLLICSAALAHAQSSRFVHRNGALLNDSAGKPVALNGVNLGGWLMWEEWIWGKGFVQQKTIYNHIVQAAGQEEAQKFRQAIYDNMITEADIKRISELCFNTVRVPFNHELLEDDAHPGVYKPEGWAVLDRLLGWCAKYHVYAVLDMHGSPGGNSGFFTADPDKKKLWEDPQNIRRTTMLWKAIAARYKDKKIVAGYDLLNEPGFPDGKKLLEVYRSITDSIRSVDKNHLLLFEGNKLATDFSMFSQLPDANAAFSFHVYTFFNKKEKNIRKKIGEGTARAKQLGIPIWCGEWGENDPATLKKTKAILAEAQYNISGSTAWTWKKALPGNVGNPATNKIEVSDGWMEMINWIRGKGKQPTPEQARKVLAEFAETVKYAHNTPNTVLLDVLKYCGN